MKQVNTTSLMVPAYAKINLSLDVLGKRSDGYHELHMVMQQISLYDDVHIQVIHEPGIHVTTDAAYLPTGEGNIAWQAAKVLGEFSGIALNTSGVAIDIKKRIPVAAGLAGGSADAAAVLKGLNQLWRLGYSMAELQVMGKRLGADVPYCLMGGSALAEGIGEKLTPLVLYKPLWVVLVKPAQSVSTREVYQRLDVKHITRRPDNHALMVAMKKGDLKTMASSMANVLEEVTGSLVPDIGDIKQKILEYNGVVSLMSGSGPTVFGLFKEKEKAESAGNKLSRRYRDVYVVHTLSG